MSDVQKVDHDEAQRLWLTVDTVEPNRRRLNGLGEWAKAPSVSLARKNAPLTRWQTGLTWPSGIRRLRQVVSLLTASRTDGSASPLPLLFSSCLLFFFQFLSLPIPQSWDSASFSVACSLRTPWYGPSDMVPSSWFQGLRGNPFAGIIGKSFTARWLPLAVLRLPICNLLLCSVHGRWKY